MDLVPVFVQRAGADDFAFDRVIPVRGGAVFILRRSLPFERTFIVAGMPACFVPEVQLGGGTARYGLADESAEPADDQDRHDDESEEDREDDQQDDHAGRQVSVCDYHGRILCCCFLFAVRRQRRKSPYWMMHRSEETPSFQVIFLPSS